MLALVSQLNDVQRLRVEADESLRGVQGLVATLQARDLVITPSLLAENELLTSLPTDLLSY